MSLAALVLWRLLASCSLGPAAADVAEETPWCAPFSGHSFGNQVLLVEKEGLGRVDLPRDANHAGGDWDGDGDIDVLVGDVTGRIRYFENDGTSLVERVGPDNPFRSVRVPGTAAPRLADWDSDGDLDVLVGAKDGQVYLYERLNNQTLQAREPVYSQLSDAYGFAPVDWDGDGDVDLIACGETETPKIRFFERSASGQLVELEGSANPFEGFRVHFERQPCHLYAADWDGDGDVDFLFAGLNVRYFERTARGMLIERVQSLNPFYDLQRRDVDLTTLSFVDWNGDGQLDIIAGPVNRIPRLRFYERVRLGGLVQMEWTGPTGLAELMDTTNHYVPCAVDWDGDGDVDLLVGCRNGTIAYYERTSDGLVHRFGSANPFDGLKVDLGGVPRAVDWDGDGDLDLLISGYHSVPGGYDGSVRYFERGEGGNLSERKGDDNPFAHFKPEGEMLVVPKAIDWDGDGDVDFLVPDAWGNVRFFERLEDGALLERWGDQNPFDGLLLGRGAVEVADWNKDGLLDLLVGTERGRVRFFQQISNASFVERRGRANPLGQVRTRFSVRPYVADWDQDGDEDLLAGVYSGEVTGVMVFNRGHCKRRDLCLSRGFTKGDAAACSCILRYTLADCSGCSRNFFSGPPDATLARECLPCPGDRYGHPCSMRGVCHDDAAALRNHPNRSLLQLASVTGNGSCTCNEPFFGPSCDQGECPAGFEYVQEELYACNPCYPGWYKAEAGNNQHCTICESGRFASHFGASACSVCVSPYFRSTTDIARITCGFAMINVPICLGVMLCSMLLLLPLPCLFRHALVLVDVRSQPSGVTVSTTGRHWLLLNRMAGVFFSGTEVPWLDEASGYRVKAVSERQLLLCDAQGEPVHTSTDTSCGTARLSVQDSVRVTGMFGIPFAAWALLFGGAEVGILYSANLWQHAAGFYVTRLEVLMLALGALIAAGVSIWRHRSLKQTDLKRDLVNFARALRENNGNPQHCSRGPARAITAGQLWDFFCFWQSYICNRNMYYVVSNVVKPLTKPLRLSYAELCGATPLQWFVSHYWGTPFCHFVATVRKHAETLSDPSPVSWMLASYWICSFANNQWRVDEEVGMSWDKSSFYLALHSGGCKGTMMVFDNEAMPLTRSWCLFELLQTAELSRKTPSFLGLLICTPSGVMNQGQTNIELAVVISKKLADLNLRDAQASCLEDKLMIDQLVSDQPGGFEQVNTYLIQAVNAALQATALRFQEDLQTLHHRLSSRSGSIAGCGTFKVDACVTLNNLTPSVTNLAPPESFPRLLGSGRSGSGHSSGLLSPSRRTRTPPVPKRTRSLQSATGGEAPSSKGPEAWLRL